MTSLEHAKALRAETARHYNCAQSVLVPFAGRMGVDEETAYRMGANFSAGMRHGATCGTVTAALMVLGLLGYEEAEAQELLKAFREKHGVTDCAVLLRQSHDAGIPRKTHCDGLVYEVVEWLERLPEPAEKRP